MCQSAVDFSLEQGLCDQEVIDPTPQKQLSFSYFEFHLIQLIRRKNSKMQMTSVRFELPTYWSSSS